MSTTTYTNPGAGRPDVDPRETDRPVRLAGGRPAWQVVAAREIMVKLRDKNFITGTVITMAVLIGVMVMNIVLASSGSAAKVGVVNDDGGRIVAAASAQAGEEGAEAQQFADRAAGEAAVRDESVDALLVPGESGWELITKAGGDQQLKVALSSAVYSDVVEHNAQQAGTSMETLSHGATLKTTALDGEDDGTEMVKFFTGLLFAILFYMASMMFGMAIAQSVIEEKQSRVVEILATAMPIRQLLAGKTIGNSVLALGQMALYIAVGVIGLQFTEYKKFLPEILGASGWYLVFFIVGFAAMACVWAAAGSMATRQEDLQSTTTPLTMILMVAFFGGMFASGMIQTVLSYIPIASSVVMPMRLLQGGAAWWEPIIALVIAIVFAVAMILLGERLYRRGLLQTSGKLSYRQALALKE